MSHCFSYHIFVASCPAESNLPVNIARFSPALFLSLLDECCKVRARASFSAQAWASFAKSSAHFKGGTPCIERNLLCVSSDCLANDPFGEEVAELEGVNFSSKMVSNKAIEHVTNNVWYSREWFVWNSQILCTLIVHWRINYANWRQSEGITWSV